MTYNATDSVLRRHYDQHLSNGGAELAGTNEEGLRMAGVAATAGGAAAATMGSASSANDGTTRSSATGNGSGYNGASTDTTSSSKTSGGGAFRFLKILIPVAIIGALGWAAMKFTGKDTEMPSVEVPTAEIPSIEMPDMPGLPEGMSDELGSAFSGASSALGGITDVDSAKAALPALDGLTGVMDKVPEAARGPLSGMVGNLTPLLEKASAIPGVGDVLAPVAEKLQGFM